jgi:uncharacterized protein
VTARAAFLFLTLTLAAGVWWLAAPLPAPARAAAVLLLALLPAAGLAQAGLAERVPALATRRELYTSSIATLWTLAAASLLLAMAAGFDAARLGLTPVSLPALAGWSALIAGAGTALVFGARRLGMREKGVVAFLLPRTARERWLFALLSATAGTAEEVMYRGVALTLLQSAGVSPWAAAVVAATAFGALHAYQGRAGMIRSGSIGFLLAIPVLVTGSLLPAIVAHTALDLLLGLLFGRRLLSADSARNGTDTVEPPAA